VNQFQVNEKAGFNFASALRALLRQDPDIVMVGEIRDEETAKLATQAALTGHLVLSTLHTNDAAGAITRLFNVGIEPYLVSATIGGVMAQRLVRKLCQNCKEAYEPGINDKRQMEKVGVTVPDKIYKPRGCAKCRNLGFAGRIGIYELLIPSDRLIERISQGAPLNEIRELARGDGMKTLRVDGVDKVRAGITTLEEVYRVTA
jgi:type IV pilus assembly protein PilB